MTTKIRPFVAAIAAALSPSLLVCSCSRETAPATKTIGISIPAADHGWTGGVVYWAGQAKKDIEAANPGVKVLVSSAKDSADQVSGIENLLVRGVDALVVLPNEPAPLTPVCKQAAGKGVKLVVVDRGLAEPVQTLEVVGDNPGFGRVSGEQLAKAIGGKGKVALMQGVLCQVNTDRVEAFKKVLAGYPEIELLEEGVSDWSTEKGLRLMENYLQKHPQLDAVWAGDDDVLLGAKKAYEESGRSDLKILLGGGGSKAVVKMVLDGDPLVTARRRPARHADRHLPAEDDLRRGAGGGEAPRGRSARRGARRRPGRGDRRLERGGVLLPRLGVLARGKFRLQSGGAFGTLHPRRRARGDDFEIRRGVAQPG